MKNPWWRVWDATGSGDYRKMVNMWLNLSKLWYKVIILTLLCSIKSEKMLNNWTTAAGRLRVGVIGIKVGEDVNHFKRRQQRRTGNLEKKSKRKHKLKVERNLTYVNRLNSSDKSQTLSHRFQK